MATKLYLTATAAGTFTGTGSGWTTPPPTAALALKRAPEGVNTAYAATDSVTTNPNHMGIRKWVAGPFLRAGTFDGGFTLVIARLESSLSMNATFNIKVVIHNADGTARTVIFNGTAYAVEWPISVAAAAATGTIAAAPVAAGEYVSVEVGFSAANTVGTAFTGTIRGGGTGTDLISGDSGAEATTRPAHITFNSASVDALFTPPAPAVIDNIGPGATQNHVALQYARPGDAGIIVRSQAELAAGFTENPYYYTTADGQRVHHEARLDAPTTPGSNFSRSEYREVDAAGADYTWNPQVGEHVMQGSTIITSLPPVKPDVVIAQIFGIGVDADIMSIRTQLVSGTIRLRVRVDGVSVANPQMSASYAVGTRFNWKMRTTSGGIREAYWSFGTDPLPATPQITTAATTETACYFKRGLYNQSNVAAGDAGTAVGAAEHWNFQIAHTAPAFTTHPAAATLAGSGALTTSGARAAAGAAALAGGGQLTATAQQAHRAASTAAGAGTLVAGVAAQTVGAAVLPAAGTLTAAAARTQPVSATLAGAGQLVATAGRGHAATATLAGTAGLSASAGQTGTATLGGGGALTASTLQTHQATAAPAGSGALAAAATVGQRATATLPAGGTLSSAAAAQRPAAVTLGGVGELSATAVRVHPAEATAGATSALTADARLAHAAGAAVPGTGGLSTAGTRVQPGVATLAAVGGLTATATATFRAAATLTGGGQLTAGGTRVQPGVAALTGAGQLAATGIRIRPAAATLTGRGQVTTAGIRLRPAAVALAASGQLIATARLAKPGLNVSLWAVTPTGLFPLPAPRKLDFSRERNAPGSVTIEYAATAPRASLLRAGERGDTHVEVEIWLNGSRDGALRGRLLQTTGDDLDSDGVWGFAGHFLEHLLDGALVYPQPSTENGELVFQRANAGTVMATVLGQAQARGALTSLSRDWTTSTDSTGQPWPATVSGLKFAPKTTLLQVVQELVELDLVEWEVTRDRVLRMWAPGRRGRNRTAGTDPATFRHGRVKGAPVRHDVRAAGTALLVLGGEGKHVEVNDASAQARRGERIERAVDAGQLTDRGSLLAYGQAVQPSATRGQREVRHDLLFGPGDPRPGAGFDLADTVISERAGGTRLAVQVQQYTLAFAAGQAVTGEVVLGDRIASRAERILSQLNAIRSGVVVAGTSEPPSAGDAAAPSAPTGLAATSIAYQDSEHSQTLAAVTLSWAAVTTNPSGPATPKAQAAQLILQRMQSGQVLYEDWTYPGAPDVVGAFNDELINDYVAAGGDPSGSGAQTYLAGYVAANSQGVTATDDVAGYRVQYAYLGLSQVGGLPSSNADGTLLNWADATPAGGITGTTHTFGSVEAGARLGLRVAAFDNTGNQSAWSTVLEIDTQSDNTPPKRAAAPTLSTWFRTLDITSNGLDVNGAAMPVDFDHDEIWISRAASFTVPTGASVPAAFNPAGTGPQHVANLYSAGTWNQPDLPIGVGWYAARRSVDRSGNAGLLSPIAGPATAEQLVQIDIGPNAVGRQQIIDLEVVRAKIDNLAVNSAKVEELDVGLVRTGTLTATVTLTGIIRTASSGLRWEGNPLGIRFYSSSGALTMDLRGDSGNALITGTIQSGTSGERWTMMPDGTLRLYPQSGTNFSSINNLGNDLMLRGPTDANGRSGRMNVNALGVGLNFSAESEIPNNLRAEIVVFDRRARITAPLIFFEINGKLAPADGSFRRIVFSQSSSAGLTISSSVLEYKLDTGLHPGMVAIAENAGWKAEASSVLVVNAAMDQFAAVKASDFVVSSTEQGKQDISDIRAVLDPLATIRAARARRYIRTADLARTPPPTPENPHPRPVSVPDPPVSLGVIAEELPAALQERTPAADGSGVELSVSIPKQLATVWGALGQIGDQQIVATSGRIKLADVAADRIAPGATLERAVTWDSAPPATPSGGFASVTPSPTHLGRVTAWLKTGSATARGAVVVVKNLSATPVVPTAATPLTIEVVGLGLYTPPYVPQEPT